MWGASPEALAHTALAHTRLSLAGTQKKRVFRRKKARAFASIVNAAHRLTISAHGLLKPRPARPSLSSPQRLVAATESIWSGRARARKRAKYYAAATAAAEEKHVEAKDEEDDRAGGTISSFLAAVLGR